MQTTMRLGEAVFQLTPLGRTPGQRAAVDSAVWAWDRETVHTCGVKRCEA